MGFVVVLKVLIKRNRLPYGAAAVSGSSVQFVQVN
jgi:hypothetical protein